MSSNDNALTKRPRPTALEQRSPHNRILVFLLCLFFGVFGVHRFWVGKTWTGLFLLLTGGGFGIVWIIDLIMIALGRFRDSDGRVMGPPKIEHRPPRDTLPPREKRRELPSRNAGEDEEEDVVLDDDVMKDPLEEKFAELEKEITKK